MSVRIQLNRGYSASVDERDVGLVSMFTWHVDIGAYNCVYARATISGGPKQRAPIRMHRLIANAPPGFHVDHIDGDGLNNVRSNLRVATPSQNQMNRGASKNNRSGYKGVSWNSRSRKWSADISARGEFHRLGMFSSPKDAYAAYCQAARELHGEFARLR